MLKWIAQNKYKVMAFIVGLYLLVDVLQHKGLTRVLLPKKDPVFTKNVKWQETHFIINKDKSWIKGVNSLETMNKINRNTGGIECDVYFDTLKKIFDVHHDTNNSTGLDLETLLMEYRRLDLQLSIWIDFKNLDNFTAVPALNKLSQLREKYGLQNKIIVESGQANLLNKYNEKEFYTSYYVPVFNPYLLDDRSLKSYTDSIAGAIRNSSANALSGYYFQYRFLAKNFPGYDILLWAPNDKFSLVNWLFKRKVATDKDAFIVLYP
jgi:hypothetical protein